ncbi:MAG: ATP-binding cassette protein, partial [Mucilaginibacter sp.]|nr:ATP-binding cassette protein [Mucilaginibacter sp.]
MQVPFFIFTVIMKVLLSYLSAHRWVVVLALVLAAFNIGFSLVDPLSTRNIFDKYVVPVDHKTYSFDHMFYGALGLVGLAICSA